MAKIEIIIKAIDQATNELSRTQGKIIRFTDVVGKAFKTMLPVVGFASIAYGMKSMIEKSVELGDRTTDLSHRLGLSVDAVQRLDYIAQRSGTSIDALSRGVKALSIAAYNNSAVLQRLGVATKDAAGNTRDVARIFNDTVIALSKIQNPAERAAVATKIFGKASTEVLGIAAKGETEIRALTDAYEKMGGSLSDEKIAQLHEAKEAMENMQFATMRLSAELSVGFVPAILAATEALAKFMALQGKMGDILGALAGGDSFATIKNRNTAEAATAGDLNYLFAVRAEKMEAIRKKQKEIDDATDKQSKTRDIVGTIGAAAVAGGRAAGGGAPAVIAAAAMAVVTHKTDLNKLLKEKLELEKQEQDIVVAMNRVAPGKKTIITDTTGGGGGGGKETPEEKYKRQKAAFDKQQGIIKSFEKEMKDNFFRGSEERAKIEADKKKKLEDETEAHQKRLTGLARTSEDMRLANIVGDAERERAILETKYERMRADHAGFTDEIALIDEQHAIEKKALNKSIEESERRKALTIALNAKAGLDSVVGQLYGMASKWKEFGAIYKAMATSQAIIDTFAAAQANYKSMSSIPYVGQALGIAAAAAAVGFGMANVVQIQAQQFARGTPSAPSGLGWVGEQGPELMRFRGGERVYSNSQSSRMGGASGQINMGGITINGNVDKSTLPAIASMQERQARLLRDILRSGAGRNMVSDLKAQLARV